MKLLLLLLEKPFRSNIATAYAENSVPSLVWGVNICNYT